MSGGLWPFWERDGLAYKVAGFSTLNPDNVMIVHLKSLDGHLNESVRYQDMRLFTQLTDQSRIEEFTECKQSNSPSP